MLVVHLRSDVLSGSLGRTLTLTEVGRLVSVVTSWEVDACSCSCSGVVVDGGLHLVQEVVDIDKIALGSEIWHRERVVRLRERSRNTTALTTDSNHLLSWHILINESAVLDRKSMQSHQALANLRI